MGAYHFWRDLGYALGALISGVIADLRGMRAAIQVIAALTLLSGLHVALRMRETHGVQSANLKVFQLQRRSGENSRDAAR
jgi:predicted MFS family arabinose efflux permease